MLITAEQKNLRQTARKVRLVANSVKNLPLQQAVQQLTLMPRRASEAILKVMQSAISNALNNRGLKIEDLKLKEIIVNDGAVYHRMQPGSRGRSKGLDKRTSHVRVALESVENKKEVKAEKSKIISESKK